MTIRYGAGDHIEGEKIGFSFGKVLGPYSEGGKQVGSLGNNGEAWVMKPLERSPKIAPSTYNEIRCHSASYSAKSIDVESKKKHVGSHRDFVGILRGEASCAIKVPSHGR